MFTIDIGLLLHVVDCAQVVTHILAAVIARYLCVPLSTEAGKSATVGSDDDITVRRHHCKVPTIAPELAYGLLGTALAIKHCGILLALIEVGRQDNPCEHLLAIGRGHHFLFNCRHGHLIEELLVDFGKLGHFTVLNQINLIGSYH